MAIEQRAFRSLDLDRGGGTGGYDHDTAKAYAESRHGVDGSLIDRHIEYALQTYAPNAVIVDVGIGAGRVAIQAVESGAQVVYGIDTSPDMLRQAATAISKAEVNNAIHSEKIHLKQGSAENLQIEDSVVNLALSVNVACNLPSHIFVPHFQEMARVTTPDGVTFVTAPTNFGEVFTSGTAGNEVGKKTKHEVLQDIASALLELRKIPLVTDTPTRIKTMKQMMGRLEDVNRATLVQRDSEFKLVYNGEDIPEELMKNNLVITESVLRLGEPIWRKLAGSATTTGLVVDNYYHPREEYLAAIQQSGLQIVTENEPIHPIMSQEELRAYNATLPIHRQLGEDYLHHSPFDIYFLKKVA